MSLKRLQILCGVVALAVVLGFGGWYVINATAPARLENAVRSNDVSAINSILRSHPELVNKVLDGNEGTGLTIAVLNSDTPTIEAVLRLPFDLNYGCPSGGTPLQWTCYVGREDVVIDLIRAAADVN
jgi:ankyrin repeat protein